MLVNTRRLTIEWGDCDPAGIVFYPRYFAMFDASTAALFARAFGEPRRRCSATTTWWASPWWTRGRPSACPAPSATRCGSRAPSTEFRRASFDVRHRLLRDDGDLGGRGFETRVWVGRHPTSRTASRRCPSRDLVARFRDPPGRRDGRAGHRARGGRRHRRDRASWATVFLAAGLDVTATDPAPGAEDALRRAVEAQWPAMEAMGASRPAPRPTGCASPPRPRPRSRARSSCRRTGRSGWT
jgi:4-hydroxybenzoyl-CoA thioesterase